jgi:predicted 3-demethylubiquinone-9 3-methyltransferase (glyoxalase superfamily)
MINQITPYLWFDNQAEEAASFYTSVFKNSKIEAISRYGIFDLKNCKVYVSPLPN